ncbi:MAG: type VI secretion system-associated FHA domain protein TagH, partial [Gammaproteobacteria bacterium]|nr:type VI secretion system-associated FHA domain protein TagH [Gammaproteobacteria bacterium]
ASAKPAAKTGAKTAAPKRPAEKPRALPTSPISAFYRGAGIEPPALTSVQAEQLMSRLGQVMRELVVGVIESLHLRALQKAQLKQSNTTIQARENNSLKFSANVEEAFHRLLVENPAQYMDPVESVRSSFSDLKSHQRAMFNAIHHAVDSYLDRLEPEQLEHKFSKGRAGSIMGAASRFKYWDLYKDVYLMLSQHGTEEMPQAFLEALAEGYERETAKSTAEAEVVAQSQSS